MVYQRNRGYLHEEPSYSIPSQKWQAQRFEIVNFEFTIR
jgi:hypothetical protein